MDAAIGLALLLPTLAGLSTVLGSLLTVFLCKPGPRFMSFMMGFSAGVMILISFSELLQEGIEETGFALAYLAFFGGMAVMFLIDVLIPHIHMGERHDAGAELRVGLVPDPLARGPVRAQRVLHAGPPHGRDSSHLAPRRPPPLAIGSFCASGNAW